MKSHLSIAAPSIISTRVRDSTIADKVSKRQVITYDWKSDSCLVIVEVHNRVDP